MLIGEYNHSIDAKGRIFMPAKFREDLGDKFIVARGIGKCLFVFPNEEWNCADAKTAGNSDGRRTAPSLSPLLLRERDRVRSGQARENLNPPEAPGARGDGQGSHRDRCHEPGGALGDRGLGRVQHGFAQRRIRRDAPKARGAWDLDHGAGRGAYPGFI